MSRLIDADALRDEVFYASALTDHVANYCLALIDYAPTIEPKRSEWKHMGDCGVTECRACGWSIEECINYNFCPDCGADMRKETP